MDQHLDLWGRTAPRAQEGPLGGARAVRGVGAASRRHLAATAGIGAAWAWLTGTGYRPERHYMRGGRDGEGSEKLAEGGVAGAPTVPHRRAGRGAGGDLCGNAPPGPAARGRR